MGEPMWALPEPAPDELPKAGRKLRTEFPVEMRKESKIGYVIINRTVDASGKSTSLNATGAVVEFLIDEKGRARLPLNWPSCSGAFCRPVIELQ